MNVKTLSNACGFYATFVKEVKMILISYFLPVEYCCNFSQKQTHWCYRVQI